MIFDAILGVVINCDNPNFHFMVESFTVYKWHCVFSSLPYMYFVENILPTLKIDWSHGMVSTPFEIFFTFIFAYLICFLFNFSGFWSMGHSCHQRFLCSGCFSSCTLLASSQILKASCSDDNKSSHHIHEVGIIIIKYFPSIKLNFLSSRAKLAEVASIQEVNVLDSADTAHLALLARPELGITFTKLHCWTLTQYTKCVFLDADTLVSYY